ARADRRARGGALSRHARGRAGQTLCHPVAAQLVAPSEADRARQRHGPRRRAVPEPRAVDLDGIVREATMNDDVAVRRTGQGAVAALLESADEEFMQFADEHLAPLRSAPPATPRVHATLRWHEGGPPDRLTTRPTLGAMDRVDRDLYRGDGELAWYRVDDLRD